MTTDFVRKFESEPDKKRQKKHDEFSQDDKAFDIQRKSANSLCFVIKISGKYLQFADNVKMPSSAFVLNKYATCLRHDHAL